MISFDLVDLPLADSEFPSSWSELTAKGAPSFFLSPEILSTWLQHSQKDGSLKLLTGYESNRPVSACILGQSEFSRHGVIRGRGLNLNISGKPEKDFLYMEFNDIIVSPNADCESLFTQLFDHLLGSSTSNWDELTIPGVATNSRISEYLRKSPPEGLSMIVDKESIAPFVDLDAIRAANIDYIEILSSNTRAQIRQSLRSYERQGPLTIEPAQSHADAIDVFRDLTTLHQAQWKAKDQAGAFGEDAQLSYHEDLISRCYPEGMVELIRIRCGDHTIACLYCFRYSNHVYYYQSGFDYSSDNKQRPGLITHYLLVCHYLQHGASTYNFLAGQDRYKMSLANRRSRLHWIRLQKPRIRLRFEEFLRQAKGRIQRRV